MWHGIASAAAIATLWTPVAATPRTVYHNAEFGIELAVPPGVRLCATAPDEHDHDPLLLLDSIDDRGCRRPERARAISVFAAYNAADSTKTLRGMLKAVCSEDPRGRCAAPPGDLRIPRMQSAATKLTLAHDSFEIVVVTQAGVPDPGFDPSVPSVNYTIRLHTTREYGAADLRVFRVVLSRIRLLGPPAR